MVHWPLHTVQKYDSKATWYAFLIFHNIDKTIKFGNIAQKLFFLKSEHPNNNFCGVFIIIIMGVFYDNKDVFRMKHEFLLNSTLEP